MADQLDFFSRLSVRLGQNAAAVALQAPPKPEPPQPAILAPEPIQAQPKAQGLSLRSRIVAARCAAPLAGPPVGEPGTLAILDARGIVEMAINSPPAYDERNPEGQPSGMVHLFVRPLLDLLGSTKATHACVVFDDRANGAEGRRAIWPEYRPHRERPEGFAAQIEACRAIAQALGVWSILSPESEGRDVCATLASRAPVDWAVHLASDDRTLGHCRNRAGCLVRHVRKAKSEVFDPHEIDRFALVGDSGAGIPGVERIGEVAASVLLGHFGSLEELAGAMDECHAPNAAHGALYDRLSSIAGLRTPARVEEALTVGQDALVTSLRLAELRRNVSDSDVPTAAQLPELLQRGPVDSWALEMIGKAWGIHVLAEPPQELVTDGQ